MSKVKAPLKIKLKVAAQGARLYFSSYKNILSFALFATFGYAFINALFDIDLLWTLATLDVALDLKLEAIRDVLFDISDLPLPNIIATIVMSALFGYVLSATFYVALKLKQKSGKAGGLGVLFGAISGGCAACGTSLLAPLLTAIGITTTSAALSFALILNIVGIALLLYSSYKVSLVIATTK